MCVSQHGRVRACVGSVVSCPTLHSSPLQMIQRWIQVAEECLRIRNYNAVFAIALGLSAHYVAYVPLLCGATHSACGVTHAPILLVLERIDAVPGFSRRLATAWGLLSRSVLDRFKALTTFTASASNFKEYRKVGWLAGWVVSWLAGWLAGCLGGWVGGVVIVKLGHFCVGCVGYDRPCSRFLQVPQCCRLCLSASRMSLLLPTLFRGPWQGEMTFQTPSKQASSLRSGHR